MLCEYKEHDNGSVARDTYVEVLLCEEHVLLRLGLFSDHAVQDPLDQMLARRRGLQVLDQLERLLVLAVLQMTQDQIDASFLDHSHERLERRDSTCTSGGVGAPAASAGRSEQDRVVRGDLPNARAVQDIAVLSDS